MTGHAEAAGELGRRLRPGRCHAELVRETSSHVASDAWFCRGSPADAFIDVSGGASSLTGANPPGTLKCSPSPSSRPRHN